MDIYKIENVDDNNCSIYILKNGFSFEFNVEGISVSKAKEAIANGDFLKIYGKKWGLVKKEKQKNVFDTSKSPEQLMREYQETGVRLIPSRMECAKIAATLPNKNLAELMDNTEKIMKWLEEGK